MSESRRAQRVAVSVQVLGCSENAGAEREPSRGFTVRAISQDISILGLGIVTEHYFEENTRVRIDIDGRPFGLAGTFVARGEVRYCVTLDGSLYKCGIRFLDIAPHDRERIELFIAAHR